MKPTEPPKPSPEPPQKVTRLRRSRQAPEQDAVDPDALVTIAPKVAVERMSGCGLSAAEIGNILGMRTGDVQLHYGPALAAGKAKAAFKVGSALFTTATDRSHRQHVLAAIFFAKTQMGWFEAQPPQDATSPPGVQGADSSHLTDDKVKARFAATMAALRGALTPTGSPP